MRTPFDYLFALPAEGRIDWREDALCRETDPEIFFPEKGERAATAIAICQDCEVRQQCLEAALERREQGVWGGTTEQERRALRKPPPNPGTPRPIRHGSTSGARTHRARGEAPCEACITAERRWYADRNRRKQAS